MDSEVGRDDRVARLSAATFRRTWLVSEELEVLPGLLEDDEELLVPPSRRVDGASGSWR